MRATEATRARGAGEGAFTLIEILVALLVVGVLGATTASSMAGLTNRVSENDRYSHAIVLAQEILEDLRALRFDDIESGSQVSEDGRLSATWKVTDDPVLVTDGPQEKGMKLIQVTVSWTWRGEEQTHELQTIYSRVTPDF